MIKPHSTSMKARLIFFFFLLITITNHAQSNFGMELSYGNHTTYNKGKLVGGGVPVSYYQIDDERNTQTATVTWGLFYMPSKQHVIKLSVGRHKNGRILDVTTYTDIFGSEGVHTNVFSIYEYLQLSPSYTYRILLGTRLVIPVEAGMSINKRINERNIRYVGIRKFNCDMNLSTGIQYSITDQLLAGIHVIYNHALSKYQGESEWGTFIPIQTGVEVSVTALFKNSFPTK